MTKDQRQSFLLRSGAWASVSVAVILSVLKLVAWKQSDSVSLFSSLLDSILDGFASVVNLLAVHWALKPADDDHRFGHGKVENLAGLVQSGFIAASALFLFYESIERFFNPREIENSEWAVAVMGVSIVLTLFLVFYQRYVISHTASAAIEADSLHYVTDLLMNIATIVAIVLASSFGWLWVDALFALLIAFYILKSAWEIGAESFQVLMDQEISTEKRDKMIQIILASDEVSSFHSLRTRRVGSQIFLQADLEMCGRLSLEKAHELGDLIEDGLEEAFPGIDVTLHFDPI